MAAATVKDFANLDGFQYEATWKGVSIGWCKDVDPTSIKEKIFERKIGELNNLVIDRIRKGGVEGMPKIVLHEVKVDRIRQLKAWAGSTGAFTISPTAEYYSEYANSGPLILHPRGVSGTADDITFLKAFPITELPKSAGDDDRELPTEWAIFPDRAALTDAGGTTIVYGYHGPAPV